MAIKVQLGREKLSVNFKTVQCASTHSTVGTEDVVVEEGIPVGTGDGATVCGGSCLNACRWDSVWR